MSYAERNREIKKILEAQFGRGKVTVKGSRGTAYGWVSIHIDYSPKDNEHRSQITKVIWKMFEAKDIKIGTYGYDDPGSDYGYGKKIHLDFNLPLDQFKCGERVTWEGKTGTVIEPNYRNPQWYMVKWDGEVNPVEFFKRDLSRIAA